MKKKKCEMKEEGEKKKRSLSHAKKRYMTIAVARFPWLIPKDALPPASL